MKILFVETIGRGGIAHYTYNLIKNLTEKDIDCTLFTSSNYEFLSEKNIGSVRAWMFFTANFFVKIFPILKNERGIPSFVRRFFKIIEYPFISIFIIIYAKLHNINIIHLQSVNLVELILILIAKTFKCKIIFTVHNITPRHKDLTKNAIILLKIMYYFCDHLIIHTQDGSNKLQEIFGIIPEKISIIPHGNYSSFIPNNLISIHEAKNELNISTDKFTILFFGGIRQSKGLDLLILAVSRVIKDIPNILLMIIGEPLEDYSKYKNLIISSGILNNIFEETHYIANNEIPKFFFAADVVALPYREITQSGVLLMAYAFGKPVIASRIGGFIESIENEKSGLLVTPGDPNDLAASILRLFRDKQLRTLLSIKGLELSRGHFAWENIADKTINIYKKFQKSTTASH